MSETGHNGYISTIGHRDGMMRGTDRRRKQAVAVPSTDWLGVNVGLVPTVRAGG